MSELVKLVYDTSQIRARYKRIHSSLMGVSLRTIRLFLGRQSARDLGHCEKELRSLAEHVEAIKDALQKLPATALTKREGNELRAGLLEYLDALGASIGQLLRICGSRRKERAGDPEFLHYSETAYAQDRIAYDDAIQNHRRLGARLNLLTSKI